MWITSKLCQGIITWHRAAELGHAAANFSIGVVHARGLGVEIDKKKKKHSYETAAMRGDAKSRYNLGWFERGQNDGIKALYDCSRKWI